MDFQPNRQQWQNNYPQAGEPRGIGGWLVLFLIGRFGSAILETITLFQIIAQTRGAFLSDTGTALYVIWVILIVGHIGLEAAIIALIFMKKMFFRFLFIIMVAYLLFVTVGYPLIVSGIQGTRYVFDPSVITFFIAAVPWTIYLFVSRRVKNTFTSKPKKAREEEDTLGWHNPSGD